VLQAPPAPALQKGAGKCGILELYARFDKRLGAKKLAICLEREYCINVSAGRVYRLMKGMKLPKMSTAKPPKAAASKEDAGICQNLLAQKFDQKAPNLVWVSDFTYVKVAGRFYYICVILDLYARKVIACRVSDRINRFLYFSTSCVIAAS
ncbi:MAG: IS3 family transposase, partial [Butyricicoccus sp.]|nr:IS3 family transposase [Butyricicoccus sp.]